MSFSCSICEQESTRICVNCTKDACSNHICDRCGCCSDCCDCELPLDEPEIAHIHVQTTLLVEQNSVEEMMVIEETPALEQSPSAVPDINRFHSVPHQESDEEAEEPFPSSENNSGF